MITRVSTLEKEMTAVRLRRTDCADHFRTARVPRALLPLDALVCHDEAPRVVREEARGHPEGAQLGR